MPGRNRPVQTAFGLHHDEKTVKRMKKLGAVLVAMLTVVTLGSACDTVRGEVSLQPRHKVAVLHCMREDGGGRVRPLVHVLGERRLGLIAEAIKQAGTRAG